MPLTRRGEFLDVALHCSRTEVLRLWAGCRILALGARLLGCRMEVKVISPDPVESPPPAA